MPPVGPPSGARPPLNGAVSVDETGRGTRQGNSTERDEALPGREPRGVQGRSEGQGRSQGQGQTQNQGEAPPLRSGRPLIGGGPFTLAVAFGLQAEQSGQPATAASADNPAQAAEVEAQAAAEEEAGAGTNQLSEEEQKVVRELQKRDQEVRRHEAAHAAAGGQHAGAPTYTYQQGPDGRQYAVGGSVSIDTSPVKGDPEATLQKARQIRAAALAPADPSGQDKSVASAASALERQAQAQIAAERRAEQAGEGGAGPAVEAQIAETQIAEAQIAGTQTADTTPAANGAAPAETGIAGSAGPETAGIQTQGAGAASDGSTAAPTASGPSVDGREGGDFGPRQNSPFDIAGLVPPRPSTGFDGTIPPPQIISITA